MSKQPQDRKPKAGSEVYTFRHDGKTYRVPAGPEAFGKARDALPGRFIRDAYMEDDGEMRMGFALFEQVADQDALDALYAMPGPEMFDHLRAWMAFKPTEEDASLGESSGSSD